MTTTKPRVSKKLWTVNEWTAFVTVLCRARRVVFDFYRMPDTKYLKAKHLRPFAKAHTYIRNATLPLEYVLAEHMGGWSKTPCDPTLFANGRWDQMIAGRGHGLCPSDCAIAFIKDGPRSRDNDTIRSRKDWAFWSENSDEALELVQWLSASLAHVRGTDVRRLITTLLKAETQIEEGRRQLSLVFFEQHPDERTNSKRLFGGWNI